MLVNPCKPGLRSSNRKDIGLVPLQVRVHFALASSVSETQAKRIQPIRGTVYSAVSVDSSSSPRQDELVTTDPSAREDCPHVLPEETKHPALDRQPSFGGKRVQKSEALKESRVPRPTDGVVIPSRLATMKKKSRRKRRQTTAATQPAMELQSTSTTEKSINEEDTMKSAVLAGKNTPSENSVSNSQTIIPVTPESRPNARESHEYDKKSGMLGNHPNVLYRSIPHDHLRVHPDYRSLPPPEYICVRSAQDYHKLRQDSWQWDALHTGRLTTSKLAIVLGLFESEASRSIRVPPSLLGHGRAVAAFQELCRDSLSSQDMLRLINRDFCGEEITDPYDIPVDDETGLKTEFASRALLSKPPAKTIKSSASASSVWIRETKSDSTEHAFRYRYSPPYFPELDGKGVSPSVGSVTRARLAWGHTQEATSILAALNYFSSHGAVIREVGLCPLEAVYPTVADLQNTYPTLADMRFPTSITFGASPDGVVQYKDGSIAVLEVKNHSPFATPRFNRPSGNSQFIIADPGPHEDVGGWIIPQLQFEMLCLGPKCTHAILVSCTGLRGANLILVERDDALIGKMLRYSAYFIQLFIEKRQTPPVNFFPLCLPKHEKETYKSLIADIKRVRSNSKVIEHLPQERIQRSPWNTKLFLDGEAKNKHKL